MCNMAVVQMLSLPLSDRCLLLIGTSTQLLRFGGVLVISVNSVEWHHCWKKLCSHTEAISLPAVVVLCHCCCWNLV